MVPQADTVARPAHELHDHAGVLVSGKGTQFDAIIASNPVAEQADRFDSDALAVAEILGRRVRRMCVVIESWTGESRPHPTKELQSHAR